MCVDCLNGEEEAVAGRGTYDGDLDPEIWPIGRCIIAR